MGGGSRQQQAARSRADAGAAQVLRAGPFAGDTSLTALERLKVREHSASDVPTVTPFGSCSEMRLRVSPESKPSVAAAIKPSP